MFSEISGKQTGADAALQWVELFNTTDQAISLYLAKVEMTSLDGATTKELMVRQPDALIEPKSYKLVIWTELEQGLEGIIEETYSTALFADALLELQLCHQTVDRIIYYNLPKEGALALDGALDPSAEVNDEGNNWCVDQGEQTTAGALGLGTPGVRNRPCN